MAVDAPAHLERGDLMHLGHRAHVPVARGAALSAENFDMAHMGEPHEAGERMDPDPLRRLLARPRLTHLLDLRLMRGRRTGDHLVTAETRLDRWDPGLTRDGDGAVTIEAGDLVLAGVDVVAKEDWLTGTGEVPRVGDDASGGGRCRLSVLRRGWAGNEESDSDAGRGELALLELRQHERAADARLHGVEVAELAPADLVHPHPLPRGPHEHHLLGDVLERAHPLSRLFETLCRARREILDRGVGFG